MKYYEEGKKAFVSGDDDTDNPYVVGSYPHRMWELGWYDSWYLKHWGIK